MNSLSTFITRASTIRSIFSSIWLHCDSTSRLDNPTITNVHSLASCRSRSPLSQTATLGVLPKRACKPPMRWRFSFSELHPSNENVSVKIAMYILCSLPKKFIIVANIIFDNGYYCLRVSIQTLYNNVSIANQLACLTHDLYQLRQAAAYHSTMRALRLTPYAVWR